MRSPIRGKQFLLLCSSSFLFFLSFSFVLAEIPDYLYSMGGRAYLGLAMGIGTVSAAFSRPVSGKLTDTWGRVPVMIFGAVVGFLVCFSYPFLVSISGLILLRFLHGISTGFKPTGTFVYAADVAGENRRGEALGILSMFGSTGMALGPSLGSYVNLHFGLETMFYTSGVLSLASILILTGLKETLEDSQGLTARALKLSRRDIFEPSVLLPTMIMFLAAYSFGTALVLTPDYSGHLGIVNKGLYFSVFMGSSVVIRVFAGRLSDRSGRPRIMIFSLLLISAGMVITGLSDTVQEFFFGAMVFGIGYGFISPVLFAWAMDIAPPNLRGRSASTVFVAMELGVGLGSTLSGSLFRGDFSHMPALFCGSAALTLIGTFILLGKGNRQDQRAPV